MIVLIGSSLSKLHAGSSNPDITTLHQIEWVLRQLELLQSEIYKETAHAAQDKNVSNNIVDYNSSKYYLFT